MNTLDVAKQAAQAAADVLISYFRSGVQMRTKTASVDLVSDADVNAERAVAAIIRDAFPQHAILGEEENSDDVDAEHLWIIDPLDGTTNFAHGIPHFAVSIAYYHNGVAQTGVIFSPVYNDWYTAERGKGAFLNDSVIHVSQEDALGKSLIGTGFYYDRGAAMKATLEGIERLFKQQIHGIRRFGTASLDLAMVASGRFAGYFEYQLFPWDFAAGRLLVEEAGGRVTTCDDGPMPLASSTIIASNGLIHDQMLQHMRWTPDTAG